MFELISHRQVDTEDRMLAPQKKNDQFWNVIGYSLTAHASRFKKKIYFTCD